MNRNDEAKFSDLPRVDINRSIFQRDYDIKTSFNAGELIPFLVDEHLPGDTFTADTNIVIRTTSPMIKPVMDNLFLDIYYFEIPNRLVWEHWKEFMGENTSGPWAQTTEYLIPQIKAPEGGWTEHTIADYMGIPTKISNFEISSLWFRAYALVWNEYFRDENLQNPTDVPKDDATVIGVNTGVLETDACKGGLCLPTNKVSDYFTKALPAPQKGGDVTIPLGSWAPVTTRETPISTQLTSGSWMRMNIIGNETLNAGNSRPLVLAGTTNENYDGVVQLGGTQGTDINGLKVQPANLWTNLGQATAASINSLRQAFATQRLLEKDARGGTRYTEMINVHFNVQSPDARLQRPEYLGGKRIPITVNQVAQTSGTDTIGNQATPQGNLTAFTYAADSENSFTKSFTEHGMILGLMTVRYKHTYQQGIDKMFSRKRRLDYYFPVFANLGEQAVKNKEIYVDGTTEDEKTFGFQEAWAEYRYKPSKVTGQMRSNASGTLDIYHFADYYETRPTLGQEWIKEDKANIDRTLSVDSSVSDQFIADIFVKMRAARPMPVYSIPGLIDHN